MKKFKIISLVLVSLLAASMFAGCGTKDVGNNEATNSINYEEFPTKLTAQKIGTIENKGIQTSDGGLYYKDDAGKYGIMSLDGKYDTGAKYSYCKPLGKYFQVMTAIPKDVNDIAGLNSSGLVDANGKEIVPVEYASFDILNDRYVKVCKVTEQTASKDDALLYYTDKMFSLSPSDDDIFYKGNWYVYDITTDKLMEGVTGTQSYTVSAYGNYIQYITDAKEQITVNAEGKNLPENAFLLQNGYYRVANDSEGTVYDSDDKELFTYTRDGFVPSGIAGEYIVASKSGDDGTKYVLMDNSGAVVTAEFNASPTLYGELIYCEKMLYDFEGNKVVDGTYTSVNFDKQTKNSWILKNDDTCTLIKKDGTVIYSAKEEGDLYFDTTTFLIKNKIDDKVVYFSLKDSDFTIEGSAFAPWIVKTTQQSGTYDLVDAISGETLISGYTKYSYSDANHTALYIYAQAEDGKIDIYTVK